MLKKKFLTFYYNFLLPSCNSIGFILQRLFYIIGPSVFFWQRSKTSGVAHGDSDLGSYFSGLCIPLFWQFFCVCIIVCRRVARQTSNAYISKKKSFSNLSKSSNLNLIRSYIYMLHICSEVPGNLWYLGMASAQYTYVSKCA